MQIKKLSRPKLSLNKNGWTFNKKTNLWQTYQIDITLSGKRIRKHGFATKSEAEKYLDDLIVGERLSEIGIISKNKYPRLSELFAKRLGDIEHKNEKNRAKRVFAVFEKLHGEHLTIDKIAKKHFKDFADFRRLQNVKKLTVNREITPIQSAFRRASDHFNLKNWMPPQVYRFKTDGDARSRLITPEEYQKLLEYFLSEKLKSESQTEFTARRRTGLVIQFLAMSGLRHGEAAGMEKSKLNKLSREIDVYRFKVNRYKILSPLTDTHFWLLSEGEKLHPESKYFFSTDGKVHNKTYSILKNACQKLNIKYGKKTDGGFILHDLRHSFSSFLHKNLIDNKTIVEFTDNPSAVDRYQHSTEIQKQAAMRMIDRAFGIKKENKNSSREIYNAVKNNKMSFKEFEKAIKNAF